MYITPIRPIRRPTDRPTDRPGARALKGEAALLRPPFRPRTRPLGKVDEAPLLLVGVGLEGCTARAARAAFSMSYRFKSYENT